MVGEVILRLSGRGVGDGGWRSEGGGLWRPTEVLRPTRRVCGDRETVCAERDGLGSLATQMKRRRSLIDGLVVTLLGATGGLRDWGGGAHSAR